MTTTTPDHQPVKTLGRLSEPMADVPLEVWRYVEHDGKETGYVEREKGRPACDVVRELADKLGDDVDEYITAGYPFKYDDVQAWGRTWKKLDEVPSFRAVNCYAVRGGSEGHYVHVDLVLDFGENSSKPHPRAYEGDPRESRTVNLVLIKTFQGADHAFALAKRCAELLGLL